MSSVTNTSIKFLPLWTEKYLPTNSGGIWQARLQVLIGEPFTPIPALTFLVSRSSTYGPFLLDLDIINDSPYLIHPNSQNSQIHLHLYQPILQSVAKQLVFLDL